MKNLIENYEQTIEATKLSLKRLEAEKRRALKEIAEQNKRKLLRGMSLVGRQLLNQKLLKDQSIPSGVFDSASETVTNQSDREAIEYAKHHQQDFLIFLEGFKNTDSSSTFNSINQQSQVAANVKGQAHQRGEVEEIQASELKDE